tara:strand:+ start:651 stop:1139 length:489 start_codon:yes stop_codon:yes gene_type:complete
MPRGQKPLPAGIAELTGAYHKDPKRKRNNQPKPPTGTPTCPRYLSRIAKAEWRHVVELLKKMNVISLADKSALTMYCQTYSEWRKSVEMCEQYGAWNVVKKPDGSVDTKRHEWDRVRERTAEACRRWLTEFGLTPSARARLQVEENTADEFDAFISRFSGDN